MAGTGFALCQSGKQFLQLSLLLSPNKEVFGTKAEAVLAEIKVALELYIAQFATNL
jgi:hypothetical protein